MSKEGQCYKQYPYPVSLLTTWQISECPSKRGGGSSAPADYSVCE